MSYTTWCDKHNSLETVDEVDKRTPIKVTAKDSVTGWGRDTGRIAYKVYGVTDVGCKVTFIGGLVWAP